MEKMSDVVAFEDLGDIALISIDNPPVNAAGAALREGLMAALERLAGGDFSAAGLYCAGRTFVAGADIREFGKGFTEPSLPAVCSALEASAVPIVAAMHGTALGGGFEIALGCHARIGMAGLRIGLPEVALGLLPGAGGTQRAPRLAGQRFVLDMVLAGKPIPAAAALEAGLIDGMSEAGEPREAALAAARAMAAGELAHRRTAALKVTPEPEYLAETRKTLAKKTPHLVAPQKIVDAIEASALPLEEGLAEEWRLFMECYDHPQRAALVHAFFAERATGKIPEASEKPRDFAHVGVIGAGTMGSGIATACLLAGLRVTLVEQSAEALERGLAAINGNLDGAVKRGKMSAEARGAVQLEAGTDFAALSAPDLIIEAAFEKLEVKTEIFARLDQIVKPGAIMASNTSYLDVDKIAAATSRPADVLGLHFFSPAHIMRLVEVVVGEGTAPDAVATGFALAKKLRKVAVRAGVCDGFIGNRILENYIAAADYMVLDGAAPADVDAAARAFGMAMGPFEMSDLAGLDIGYLNRQSKAASRPPERRYSPLSDRIVEAGMLGRKSGSGYYDYSGAAPVPNPAVEPILAEVRAEKGITPRDFAQDELVERYLTAFISEAADVVEEGIALKPSDVDAVFLFGYGFPRHMGGPLFHADRIGAGELCRRIAAYAKEDAHFWRVRPLLARMAETGQTFDDLNKEG